MRGKDLLECIEQIDDALVEEAMDPPVVSRRDRNGAGNEGKNKNSIIVKWGMTAACVIAVGISATVFWSHQNIKEGQVEGGDTAAPIAMTGSDNSASVPSGGGQTAGAAENAQAADAAGSDSDSFDGAAPSDLCALPAAGESSGAGDDTDSGSDADSRDLTADAASGAEGTAVMEYEKAKQESVKPAYTVISDYYGEEEDDSVYDYPVPGKGEFYCYHYLQETMEYYAEQEKAAGTADSPTYAYDVVIDIYGDIEKSSSEGTHYDDLNMQNNSGEGNKMIEQEYRRLSELGYAVRLSEDFRLTGIFTKEELDTFQASPEYGYTFRFANEY